MLIVQLSSPLPFTTTFTRSVVADVTKSLTPSLYIGVPGIDLEMAGGAVSTVIVSVAVVDSFRTASLNCAHTVRVPSAPAASAQPVIVVLNDEAEETAIYDAAEQSLPFATR
jgi:hypothetical protein